MAQTQILGGGGGIRSWGRAFPADWKRAYCSARAGLRLLPRMASPLSWLQLWRGPLAQARRHSLLSTARLLELYRLAREVNQAHVEGDFVECGVYRGGSAAMMGYALLESPLPRQLWLFDSFQGLPKPGAPDGEAAQEWEGRLAADPAKVTDLLVATGVPPAQMRIVPGRFEESFPAAAINKIALLHIDADWYASVKVCLERFYDVLQDGSVVVLDDYHDWPGCRRALEDFARQRGLQIELQNGAGAPYFRVPGGGPS